MASVTVVIPTFNDGSKVFLAVESAMEAGADEVVVVDDGSTDHLTLVELAYLSEEPNVLVLSQPNSGTAAARLHGAVAATSDYVQFLDADDLLMPWGLGLLRDTLDARPRLDVVWGKGREMGGKRVWRKARDINATRLRYFNDVPYSSMFRRAVYLENAYPYNGPHQDWDMWMGMAERGVRGSLVPIETVLWDCHSDGQHGRGIARHEEIRRDLRERHPDLYKGRNWRDLIEALPVSRQTRYRILLTLDNPREVVRNKIVR